MARSKKRPQLKARKTTALAVRPAFPPALLADVRALIETARERVASSVNAQLTLLYWQIGRRIRESVFQGDRAAYGENILHALSAKLTEEFGAGYTPRNLSNMVRFAEVFPDENILHALRAKLSWTHIRLIIYVENPLAREFYAEMARLEGWSTRTLEERINSMLFERTAISRKPANIIKRELRTLRKSDEVTPALVFRDPLFLDFLGLRGEFSEKDLESAIIRELERFILEMGTDFAFVARQKRITIDGEDYYIDLLFFHRRLGRLVAIDLKLGKFQAGDKGQMELYLRWLNKYERRLPEEQPIGLILCAGKSDEHVELLELNKSGIHVAQYMTELPPRALMEKKLKEAILLARQHIRQAKALK